MIKAENFKEKAQDTYLTSEPDVLKTNAADNALWEIKSLRNHYCKEVRDLVELFPNIEKVNVFCWVWRVNDNRMML